jgi:hypothetical protein
MERTEETKPVDSIFNGIQTRLGVLLVALGLLFLLDLYFQTGWLSLAVLPAAGVLSLAAGVYGHRKGWLIGGCIVLGIGIAAAIGFAPAAGITLLNRIGLGLCVFGAAWLLVVLLTTLVFHRPAWWALIPASVIIPTGLVFLFTPMHVFDFVFYVLVGLAIGLLIWGFAARLFGLIIPGSLLLGIGPGIYIAWGVPLESNSLAQIGIMLVSFALGWGLITLFSRRVTHAFVWWPIIPGAVLAISGWGLYIGGNPGNAVSFISNTGSIGLVLFGLYLLLMKRGIQK